jgi:glycerol uptake facilitator protein
MKVAPGLSPAHAALRGGAKVEKLMILSVTVVPEVLRPTGGARSLGSQLIGECLAEIIGTFALILIGDGMVASAVLIGGYDNVGVAVVWGMAVMVAVYVAGGISGAHLNPAITLAFGAFRKFPKWKMLPFMLAQVIGAFLGAAAVGLAWREFLPSAASKFGVTIGQPGSQRVMMFLSCFYPNPGAVGTAPGDLAKVSTGTAFATEMVMTMVLLMAVLALVDSNNPQSPKSNLAPLFIGVVVTALVAIGAPITMTALNPARDFGPRLFGYLTGWGHVALPGPRGNEWWLYILAPSVGGVLGGAIYEKVLRRSLPNPTA